MEEIQAAGKPRDFMLFALVHEARARRPRMIVSNYAKIESESAASW